MLRLEAQKCLDIEKEDMKSAAVGEEDAKETDRRKHCNSSGEP